MKISGQHLSPISQNAPPKGTSAAPLVVGYARNPKEYLQNQIARFEKRDAERAKRAASIASPFPELPKENAADLEERS